jgi:hypothetical protein
LVSKQLNLLSYIDRTSDNQRINRIEQELERIEEIKFFGKYLIQMLVEEGLDTQKDVDSWRFEF